MKPERGQTLWFADWFPTGEKDCMGEHRLQRPLIYSGVVEFSQETSDGFYIKLVNGHSLTITTPCFTKEQLSELLRDDFISMLAVAKSRLSRAQEEFSSIEQMIREPVPEVSLKNINSAVLWHQALTQAD